VVVGAGLVENPEPRRAPPGVNTITIDSPCDSNVLVPLDKH
jgi:hypothetical protein